MSASNAPAARTIFPILIFSPPPPPPAVALPLISGAGSELRFPPGADLLRSFEASLPRTLLPEAHVGCTCALDVIRACVGIPETRVFDDRAWAGADVHGCILTGTATLYD